MNISYDAQTGLVPVIIQNAISLQILMLGYMNEEAFKKTQAEGRVTFYSRKRQSLWTKGETSGNFLEVVDMKVDCDQDTILIQAIPKGPTCHTGAQTCFEGETSKGFLYQLENTIKERIENPNESSYTNALFQRGMNKMAQKVGEEAVELVIEAKDNNQELFENEAADLLYHLTLLLQAKGSSIQAIEEVLLERSK